MNKREELRRELLSLDRRMYKKEETFTPKETKIIYNLNNRNLYLPLKGFTHSKTNVIKDTDRETQIGIVVYNGDEIVEEAILYGGFKVKGKYPITIYLDKKAPLKKKKK